MLQTNSYLPLNFTACPLHLVVYNITVGRDKTEEFDALGMNITAEMLDITDAPGVYLLQMKSSCGYVTTDYSFQVHPYIPAYRGPTHIFYGKFHSVNRLAHIVGRTRILHLDAGR